MGKKLIEVAPFLPSRCHFGRIEGRQGQEDRHHQERPQMVRADAHPGLEGVDLRTHRGRPRRPQGARGTPEARRTTRTARRQPARRANP